MTCPRVLNVLSALVNRLQKKPVCNAFSERNDDLGLHAPCCLAKCGQDRLASALPAVMVYF